MPSTKWKGLSRVRARRAYRKGYKKGKQQPHTTTPPPSGLINAVLRALYERGFRHGQQYALTNAPPKRAPQDFTRKPRPFGQYDKE